MSAMIESLLTSAIEGIYARLGTRPVFHCDIRYDCIALGNGKRTEEMEATRIASAACRPDWLFFLVSSRYRPPVAKARGASGWTPRICKLGRLPTMSHWSLRELASFVSPHHDPTCDARIGPRALRWTFARIEWIDVQSQSKWRVVFCPNEGPGKKLAGCHYGFDTSEFASCDDHGVLIEAAGHRRPNATASRIRRLIVEAADDTPVVLIDNGYAPILNWIVTMISNT